MSPRPGALPLSSCAQLPTTHAHVVYPPARPRNSHRRALASAGAGTGAGGAAGTGTGAGGSADADAGACDGSRRLRSLLAAKTLAAGRLLHSMRAQLAAAARTGVALPACR